MEEELEEISRSSQDFIVALVVIHPQYCKQWAKTNGLANESLSSLTKNEKLKKEILKDFEGIAKQAGKKGFEQIKNVVLIEEEWTPENGMLTNSMKLKRQDINKRWMKDIDRLYSGPPKLQSKL